MLVAAIICEGTGARKVQYLECVNNTLLNPRELNNTKLWLR